MPVYGQPRSGALEPGDIEEGMRAAEAIGDDTLQKQTQGKVSPDKLYPRHLGAADGSASARPVDRQSGDLQLRPLRSVNSRPASVESGSAYLPRFPTCDLQLMFPIKQPRATIAPCSFTVPFPAKRD